MTSRVRFIGGAWRTAKARKKYIGGAWRTATRRMIYIAGAWHNAETYVLPLSASASPTDASGTATGKGNLTITTNTVTVTPIGGLAPFSYSWSASPGITITNPGNATTAFSKLMSPFQETIASATCTITDALGTTATADVSIDITHGGF